MSDPVESSAVGEDYARRTPSDPHVVEDQTEVLMFLADPNTHRLAGGTPVVRIDTHGAVVFLAGPDVFKVKRAVRYPFMDLSTLEKRRIACEAEVVINAPNAPGIYLGAVPITRSDNVLSVNGAGEIVEWTVHMRRFDETQTLDRLAERGDLTPELCAKIARAVLVSHRRARQRDGGPATNALAAYIEQNEAAFNEQPELFDQARIARLSTTTRSLFAETRPGLLERGWEGFVRRCHGDLHLRNLVLLNGEPTLFDAIEFDEAIATGDVLYDLAFLLMDLWERDLRAEANLVLNRYLSESADERQLRGLAGLPLFLSLRAAIRAKVTGAALPHLAIQRQASAREEAQRYFAWAEAFLTPSTPRLVAIGGLSGTGKTTLATQLACSIGRAPGAVHLRSDIERKGLFGGAELQRLPDSAYEPDVTEAIYASLRHKAGLALVAGQSVIIDAAQRRPEERDAAATLAAAFDVPFTGLWLEAPTDLLRHRVEMRRGDASDATPEIVTRQAAQDLGNLKWRRLDASGSIDQIVAAALMTIKSPDPR